MKFCPLCGVKFLREGETETWVVCGDCYDAGLLDGSTEQWTIARSLFNLVNHKWSDADAKMVADSSAFVNLCENILPLVEAKQLSNLLKRVMRQI